MPIFLADDCLVIPLEYSCARTSCGAKCFSYTYCFDLTTPSQCARDSPLPSMYSINRISLPKTWKNHIAVESLYPKSHAVWTGIDSSYGTKQILFSRRAWVICFA